MSAQSVLASTPTVNWLTGWKFTGNFTIVDLIAASTNALNGALLARRPDHYKNFTVVGVLLHGAADGARRRHHPRRPGRAGPGGAHEPGLHHTVRIAFGFVGYKLAFAEGQLFREGLFQFMTSFSLPLVRDRRAPRRGSRSGCRSSACCLLAVVGPTAGRWYVDVSSGVPPKQFIRGEWFVAHRAADRNRLGRLLLIVGGRRAPGWPPVISFVIGYTLRVLALYRGWEEPLAKEPQGVYMHDDGRPLLGRKIAGKSQRELRDLGLLVEDGDRDGQIPVTAGTH